MMPARMLDAPARSVGTVWAGGSNCMSGRARNALSAAVESVFARDVLAEARMSKMEHTDLVVAGYVLTLPADAPPNDDALPPKILTISDCIMADFPRPEFWDWFLDVDDAKQAQAATASHPDVMQVAMRRSDVPQFVAANGGADQPHLSLLTRDQTVRGGFLVARSSGPNGRSISVPGTATGTRPKHVINLAST